MSLAEKVTESNDLLVTFARLSGIGLQKKVLESSAFYLKFVINLFS